MRVGVRRVDDNLIGNQGEKYNTKAFNIQRLQQETRHVGNRAQLKMRELRGHLESDFEFYSYKLLRSFCVCKKNRFYSDTHLCRVNITEKGKITPIYSGVN